MDEAKEGIGAFIEKRKPDWPRSVNHDRYSDAYIRRSSTA